MAIEVGLFDDLPDVAEKPKAGLFDDLPDAQPVYNPNNEQISSQPGFFSELLSSGWNAPEMIARKIGELAQPTQESPQRPEPYQMAHSPDEWRLTRAAKSGVNATSRLVSGVISPDAITGIINPVAGVGQMIGGAPDLIRGVAKDPYEGGADLAANAAALILAHRLLKARSRGAAELPQRAQEQVQSIAPQETIPEAGPKLVEPAKTTQEAARAGVQSETQSIRQVPPPIEESQGAAVGPQTETFAPKTDLTANADALRKSSQPETSASAAENASTNVASVPVMITKQMEVRLKALGATDADIAQMTPAEAHEILSQEADVNAGTAQGRNELTQTSTEYRGEHGAPDSDSAPLHDLTTNAVYPSDVYGAEGSRYYGDQSPHDAASFSIISQFKGRPKAQVRVFRAVPLVLTNEQIIAKIETAKRAVLARGKIPANAPGAEGFSNSSRWYDWANGEIERLKSAPPVEVPDTSIRPGDWVTINRGYAKEHGEANLNGKFKIVSKLVSARDIFTNGDSLHEWGYDPQPNAEVGLPPQIEPGITAAIAEINRRNAPATKEVRSSVEPQVIEPQPEQIRKPSGLANEETGAPPLKQSDSSSGEDIPTSTRNATTNAEREARGIPAAEEAARRDFGTVWDEAAADVAKDAEAPRRLVAEIAENPRALSDKENALLLRRQIEVQNEHSAAVDALNAAPESPEAMSRLETARNDLQAVYDAGKAAGTESGRGLNARRMLANNDFTLARMEAETRAVANAGRPLSPKQAAEVKTLWERVNKAEAKIAEYEANGDIRKSLQSARQARNKPFSVVQFFDEKSIAARERIVARRGKLYADPLGVTHVAHLADEAIIGAAHIARGVKNFKDWSAAMLKDFGDGIKPYLKALFAKSQGMHSEAARLAMSKARTVGSTVKVLRKIGSGDLEPTKLPPIRPDRELMDLRANLQRAKDVYAQRLEQQRLKNRSFGRRAADTFVKTERAMKLTGITTLGKLLAAGGTRLVSTAVEEAVGGLLSHSPLLKRIASEAPREGGLNLRSEVLAPTQGLMRGIRNIPRVLKGERTTEEALYGKHNLRYESGSPLDIPGRIHGAIKSPFKEAERTRSQIKREAFAERKGEDLADPATQEEIGKAANLDAQRAIFMQDNVLSDWFRSGVRSLETNKKFPTAGFAAAKVANFLLPIVKVPTNIAFETMTHIGGTVSASVKLATVMKRGLRTIKPEEADMIMRHYKKGVIGVGLFLTGYFNADKFGGFYQRGDKRKDEDVRWGGAKIAGLNIPPWLLHAPAFIVLQAGSTAYRMQHKLYKGEEKGKLHAAMAVAEGLAHEIPFVNEMSRIDKILSDSWEGTKARGDLLRSTVVPQGVQNAAGWMDAKTVHRSPKTEVDYLKMGVPGLRHQVPEKSSNSRPKMQRPNLKNALHKRKLGQIEEYLVANRAA